MLADTNLFKGLNRQQLRKLYGQFVEWQNKGSLSDNELGAYRDKYFAMYGTAALLQVQMDLLLAIAEDWKHV